jgi:aldose 1-epimerase
MKVYRLTNRSGDALAVLAKGATLQRWSVRLGSGRRDLILHYPQPEAYAQDPYYLGALVGPFANRIGGGVVSIDQQTCQLEQNEGFNHLHGGSQGLHMQHWHCIDSQPARLVLACEIEDGQGGYPGPTAFQVTYKLGDDGTLDVCLEARASRPTLVGPTLHPYLNLSSAQDCIDHHQLRINASHYTAVDNGNIPTGELRKVQNSELDFSHSRALVGSQLDHNFVVSGDLLKPCAELLSPDQRLRLAVSSDYPGLQVYTGEHLNRPFRSRQGVCLEPQFFPDSPNHKGFPFHFTRPDKPFVAHIRYQLEKA